MKKSQRLIYLEIRTLLTWIKYESWGEINGYSDNLNPQEQISTVGLLLPNQIFFNFIVFFYNFFYFYFYSRIFILINFNR